MPNRYSVDERVGCIAVRDRTRKDPGVVWFRLGRLDDGVELDLNGVWPVSDSLRAEAHAKCDELNAKEE